jgi:hypothetical protein
VEELRRNLAFSFLFLALLLVTVFAFKEVSAQTTTISLSPPSVKDVPTGETFSVNVTISDASNIYSWQVNMTFNPSVLSVEGATEGSFLKNFNATVWPNPSIQNDKGRVLISALFNVPFPSTGASGGGVLATITFKVKSGGSSALDFVDGTKLGTVESGHYLPIENFVSQDGSFGSAAGGLNLGVPLEIIAVVAVVIVVAVVGGVFFLRRRRE